MFRKIYSPIILIPLFLFILTACSVNDECGDCKKIYNEIIDSLNKNSKETVLEPDFCKGYNTACSDDLTYIYSGAVYPHCSVLDIESKGIKVEFENMKAKDQRELSYKLGYKSAMLKRLQKKFGNSFGVTYDITDTSACIDRTKLQYLLDKHIQIKRINSESCIAKIDSTTWQLKSYTDKLVGIYGEELFQFNLMYDGIIFTKKTEYADMNKEGDSIYTVGFSLENFNHPKFVGPKQAVITFNLK